MMHIIHWGKRPKELPSVTPVVDEDDYASDSTYCSAAEQNRTCCETPSRSHSVKTPGTQSCPPPPAASNNDPICNLQASPDGLDNGMYEQSSDEDFTLNDVMSQKDKDRMFDELQKGPTFQSVCATGKTNNDPKRNANSFDDLMETEETQLNGVANEMINIEQRLNANLKITDDGERNESVSQETLDRSVPFFGNTPTNNKQIREKRNVRPVYSSSITTRSTQIFPTSSRNKSLLSQKDNFSVKEITKMCELRQNSQTSDQKKRKKKGSSKTVLRGPTGIYGLQRLGELRKRMADIQVTVRTTLFIGGDPLPYQQACDFLEEVRGYCKELKSTGWLHDKKVKIRQVLELQQVGEKICGMLQESFRLTQQSQESPQSTDSDVVFKEDETEVIVVTSSDEENAEDAPVLSGESENSTVENIIDSISILSSPYASPTCRPERPANITSQVKRKREVTSLQNKQTDLSQSQLQEKQSGSTDYRVKLATNSSNTLLQITSNSVSSYAPKQQQTNSKTNDTESPIHVPIVNKQSDNKKAHNKTNSLPYYKQGHGDINHTEHEIYEAPAESDETDLPEFMRKMTLASKILCKPKTVSATRSPQVWGAKGPPEIILKNKRLYFSNLAPQNVMKNKEVLKHQSKLISQMVPAQNKTAPLFPKFHSVGSGDVANTQASGSQKRESAPVDSQTAVPQNVKNTGALLREPKQASQVNARSFANAHSSYSQTAPVSNEMVVSRNVENTGAIQKQHILLAKTNTPTGLENFRKRTNVTFNDNENIVTVPRLNIATTGNASRKETSNVVPKTHCPKSNPADSCHWFKGLLLEKSAKSKPKGSQQNKTPIARQSGPSTQELLRDSQDTSKNVRPCSGQNTNAPNSDRWFHGLIPGQSANSRSKGPQYNGKRHASKLGPLTQQLPSDSQKPNENLEVPQLQSSQSETPEAQTSQSEAHPSQSSQLETPQSQASQSEARRMQPTRSKKRPFFSECRVLLHKRTELSSNSILTENFWGQPYPNFNQEDLDF